MASMKPIAPDLRMNFPRSPNTELAGLVHLARMLDKARAKAAGTLGEYIFPCPLDDALLAYLGVSGDHLQRVAQDRDDAGVVAWLAQAASRHSDTERAAWNAEFRRRRPRTEESARRFQAIRDRVATDRTDVTTWPDLLDLEEGRPVPPRVRPA